jgi:hypothetical protein
MVFRASTRRPLQPGTSAPSFLLDNRRKMRRPDRESHRRFYCARCQAVVLLCRRCDSGQRYCGKACRTEARRESLRRAGRRYQRTPAGRASNAERQQRFRARRAADVTHQGPARRSKPPGRAPRTVDAGRHRRVAPLLASHREQSSSENLDNNRRDEPLCSRCSRPCSRFTRFEFLRE